MCVCVCNRGLHSTKRYCGECRYMCPILTQLMEFKIFIVEMIAVTNNLYKAVQNRMYTVAEKRGLFTIFIILEK